MWEKELEEAIFSSFRFRLKRAEAVYGNVGEEAVITSYNLYLTLENSKLDRFQFLSEIGIPLSSVGYICAYGSRDPQTYMVDTTSDEILHANNGLQISRK